MEKDKLCQDHFARNWLYMNVYFSTFQLKYVEESVQMNSDLIVTPNAGAQMSK